MIKKLKIRQGLSIIEILITGAIIAIALTSFFGVFISSLKTGASTKKIIQANTIAQETMEAVRNFRDGTQWEVDGLGVLTAGANYFPQKSGLPAVWTLIQGEETVDSFTRKVVFGNVARDASDNIVTSGGINDPNTKKANITISWTGGEVKISTFFTNWR